MFRFCVWVFVVVVTVLIGCYPKQHSINTFVFSFDVRHIYEQVIAL